MKKIILLSVVVLQMLMPSTASAAAPTVATITIAPDGLSFTVNTGGVYFGPGEYEVTFCDGSILNSEAYFLPGDNPFAVDKPISRVVVHLFYPPTSTFEKSRPCPIEAEPLFMMWLLTRGDPGCILLSETHPSVERQKALCFPVTDPDWVADNAPCADYIYDNDTWSCDAFGFSGLPLHSETGPDLMDVWQRHAARQQE